jgi:hypothetical protein
MAFALFPLGERNTGLQFNWFNILLHWAQVAQGEWPKIRCKENSGGTGDLQIVRAIGDQFVAKGFANGAVFDEENARHAFHIARENAERVTMSPGLEGAQNTLVIEESRPVGTQQTEGELRAEGFNLRAQLGDVVDGFAAESAAEVAEKNEEDGELTGKIGNGLASLRFVIFEKRGINSVGWHLRLAFPDFGR